jgi:bifunctional DNA-binding transcriptional regulator/antitoxin component of YhaV-PrlF toxin-antitoxin module
MQRKLIRQGKGALTISLPKKWVDANGLQAGEVVELGEENNDLFIKRTGDAAPASTSIRIALQPPEAYRSILGGLYRGGYDVIHVEYEDEAVLPNLQKAVDSLYGFELFYDESGCTVRSIYTAEQTEVGQHVRRIIHAIAAMQEVVSRDVSKKQFDATDELLELRNNVLKQRDLVIRMIKRQRLLDNGTFPYYTITLALWGVARNYYHMYMQEAVTDKDFLAETNMYFKQSFSHLASLSKEEFLKRHARYAVIHKRGMQKMQKRPSVMLSYCLSIISEIQLADSSVYLLNHG